MPTFSELQEKYKDLSYRKAILVELIDHLETNFIENGKDPDPTKMKVMLTEEESLRVPTAAIEQVLQDVLLKAATATQVELEAVKSSTMATAEQEPAPEQKSKKSKTQPEAAPE